MTFGSFLFPMSVADISLNDVSLASDISFGEQANAQGTTCPKSRQSKNSPFCRVQPGPPTVTSKHHDVLAYGTK